MGGTVPVVAENDRWAKQVFQTLVKMHLDEERLQVVEESGLVEGKTGRAE